MSTNGYIMFPKIDSIDDAIMLVFYKQKGFQPIHVAAYHEELGVVNLFIEKYHIDPTVPTAVSYNYK